MTFFFPVGDSNLLHMPQYQTYRLIMHYFYIWIFTKFFALTGKYQKATNKKC